MKLGLIIFLVYTYQDTIRLGIANFEDRFLPCSRPVYYSLGTFDARFVLYQKANNEYNTSVDFWNKNGGAPADEYAGLEDEGVRLREEGAALLRVQASLNTDITQVNRMVDELNTMAKSLNLNVAHYNAIGEEVATEFEEGRYYNGPEGEGIDIYQFENITKLRRVLAHEFGHALGLEHVEDPEAIMYLLNTSDSVSLSAGDLAELARVCEKKI